MSTTYDYTKLREELLAHIYDEEHSDITSKTYRISSMEDPNAILPITIKAKTQLGAIIAYMDWDMEYGTLRYKYWSDFVKEWNNQDIGEYATVIINKFFNSELDEDIKEVEEIIISPFTGENTKSGGKC